MKKAVPKSSTSGGSEFTTFEPGDGVVCQREKVSKGTWEAYRGKIGKVVTINTQRFENDHADYVEVGVVFTKGGRVTWFRNDELQPFDLPAHLRNDKET